MNYVWLTLLSAFALDWLLRMIGYAKTGDEKFKHNFIWWR